MERFLKITCVPLFRISSWIFMRADTRIAYVLGAQTTLIIVSNSTNVVSHVNYIYFWEIAYWFSLIFCMKGFFYIHVWQLWWYSNI